MDEGGVMTSSKPYLLRALHEWIIDNGLTPHLIVDANAPDVEVPDQAIQDGRVVLNVSPSATRSLQLDNDYVSFHARFSGVGRELWLPMAAILAIYARENGQGMMFTELSEEQPEQEKPSESKGPTLRVIK